MTPLHRYQQAHRANQDAKYPLGVKDHGYIKTVMPDCNTANGLTRAIVNFLLWNGHRATRINSAGRVIKAPQRQASGVSLMTAKYIPGATRRGAADISATIKGRSCMLEIKCGADRPSQYQLAEQELERKAGGVYEFMHSFDEFLLWYDNFIQSL